MSCASKAVAISFDLAVAVTVLCLLVLVESGIIEPIKAIGFYCNDPKLSYKLNGECINSKVLLILTYAFPIFVFFLVELFTSKGTHFKTSWPNRGFLRYADYLHGSLFTLVATEIGKILFGEPRPHFLDSCKPLQAINCTSGDYFSEYTCTNRNYTYITGYNISDTYKSFPSGHTSLACFTSLYFAFYFHEKIRSQARSCLSILYLTCFTWALVCSVTRVLDHRHHWWDVLFGAILGLSAGWYYYNYHHKYYHDGIEKDDLVKKSVNKRLISPNA